MKINEAFRADLQNSVLCWLATVDPSGAPNVTPKEIFALHDDETLVVADIMSANSIRNIRARPRICLSFVDVFRQRGFKVTGVAEVIAPEDRRFATFARPLAELAGPDFPIRHVIVLSIERVGRILAPSYRLFPDRSEERRMNAAYRRYGVQAAKPE